MKVLHKIRTVRFQYNLSAWIKCLDASFSIPEWNPNAGSATQQRAFQKGTILVHLKMAAAVNLGLAYAKFRSRISELGGHCDWWPACHCGDAEAGQSHQVCRYQDARRNEGDKPTDMLDAI